LFESLGKLSPKVSKTIETSDDSFDNS
jgi:hypothetical protein